MLAQLKRWGPLACTAFLAVSALIQTYGGVEPLATVTTDEIVAGLGALVGVFLKVKNEVVKAIG